MQLKAMVGVILIAVALILIGLSLVVPWYRIEVSMSGWGTDINGESDYYLDHFESHAMGMSEKVSYDNATVKDSNLVKTFRTTQVLASIGIIGCVIGLISAFMVTFEKIGSKLGSFIVLVAVILSLIAPFYIMFALPTAMSDDSADDSEDSTLTSDMEKEFFLTR